jgi:hypothetical protein
MQLQKDQQEKKNIPGPDHIILLSILRFHGHSKFPVIFKFVTYRHRHDWHYTATIFSAMTYLFKALTLISKFEHMIN